MGIADEMRKMHADVLAAIDGMTEDELTKPETIGKWSARDVLLHMSLWDGEAIKGFAVWRTGHDYDWTYAQEYLKLNECWQEMTKGLSAIQAVQTYNLVRGALINDTACIGDAIWEKRGGIPKWLHGIAIVHNQWHLEKLQAYRQSLGR